MYVFVFGSGDGMEGKATVSGADPGFPIGGGANRPGGGGLGGGRQHIKMPNFPKNCMKLRKFRAVGREGPSPP